MRALFAGTACLLLAGCSTGLHSDTPAAQVYTLRVTRGAQDPASRQDPAPRKHAPSLRVRLPLVDPGLDTSHIVLVQSDHRMSYYVASRWPASLPDVVESLLTQALGASDTWSAVQSSGSGFQADYLLQVIVRRFEADYTKGPAPEVHVLLDCTVGRRTDHDIVATFEAEGVAPAAANRLGDVVSAFETAVNTALSVVVERAAEAARS